MAFIVFISEKYLEVGVSPTICLPANAVFAKTKKKMILRNNFNYESSVNLEFLNRIDGKSFPSILLSIRDTNPAAL